MSTIRNFAIIAHIDHGKSTLADRFLEVTKTVEQRKMRDQMLDAMDLERERGITIKMQPVRMHYTASDGKQYILNLIDTPGHVDFTYEVSRALAASEGVLLLVDAAQGIEAQTISHAALAQKLKLRIIPVVNKIDLPNAQPEAVAQQIAQTLNLPVEEVLFVSGKTGQGVEALLEAIVQRIPAPKEASTAPAKALIFDSMFDGFTGTRVYVRVVEGQIKTGERLLLMQGNTKAEAQEVGYFLPQRVKATQLGNGEVGYINTGLKESSAVRIGDTVTHLANPAQSPLPGYEEIQPKVFAGLFPRDADDFPDLEDALTKLVLNDSAVAYEPFSSQAFGAGFRIGALGLLHLEIVRERLRREFSVDVVMTAPQVRYRVKPRGQDDYVDVETAGELDHYPQLDDFQEPWITIEILSPARYQGAMMELLSQHRAQYKDVQYLDQERVALHYEMPLAELMLNFFDELKSASQGYASLNYDLVGYRSADLVRVEILLHGDAQDLLSFVCPREEAERRGRAVVIRLKEVMPRELFPVPLQAAIGGKVIARETVPAQRKDVTAKLYGGDVTRKRKLLEKQKAGKKRLAKQGRVTLPQEALFALFSKAR